MSILLVQGCCTKLRQNPLLPTSFGASTLFVWTVSLNGLTVPVGNVEYRLKHEMHIGFWWGKLREREHFENPGVAGRIILKWIFRKWVAGSWTGSIWLMIGIGGGHL